MSQKFYKTNEFKQLDAEWKKKLKDSGFEDLEDDQENIDRGSWDFRRPKAIRAHQTKTEYYYMATQFLNDYNFDTELEKIIWTYHTEGIGVRNISKILNAAKISTLKKQAIHNIIMHLNRNMRELYSNGYNSGQ